LKTHSRIWIAAVLTIILVLAAYLRVDFLRSVNHHIPHDTKNYDIMVRQLLEQGVYGYKSTESNAQVMPGLPLYMAAIYKIVDYTERDPFPYIRYANAVLSLVTLVLIFLLARRLAGPYIALAAAFVSAIYPPFVWANGAILTEVPATLLLTAYFYWQVRTFDTGRWTDALIAGLLLGATALVRAEFLPLVAALYLFYWLWKRKKETWKLAVVSCIGIALIMSPWWIRNLAVMNDIIITATQTNPFTAGTYPNKNYEDGLVDRRGKTQNQVAKERLIKGFTEHTWTFVKWYTIGKLDYTYSRMFFGAGHKPLYPVIPLRNEFHTFIIWAGVAGMAMALFRWRQPITAMAVVIICMSLLRLLFVPEYRYNFTIMSLFILFACFAVGQVATWIRSRWRTSAQQT
jgi:4-amino-4-deoxy-L-arabinose transferase-like glycosyltransferase